jgi:surface-adhesin protein E
MSKVFLTVLLAVLCGNASAQWVEVGSNREQTVFADFTVAKQGNTVQMWDLFNFRSGQVMTLGKQYLSQMSLHEYDCAVKRVRMLNFSQHSEPMAEGEELFRDVRPGSWQSVVPGSPIELLWKIACSNK